MAKGFFARLFGGLVVASLGAAFFFSLAGLFAAPSWLVSAYGGSGQDGLLGRGDAIGGGCPMMEYHEEVEELLEEGSFADLEALREELGVRIAPWVVDEESFLEWREHHARMEEMMGGVMSGRGPRGLIDYSGGAPGRHHGMRCGMMGGTMAGAGMAGSS